MKISDADRKVSEHLRAIANQLDKAIEQAAGKRMGFSLVVFNDTPGSRVNYCSNCDRDEVAKALIEMLANWDAGMPDIPSHEIQG